MKKILAYPAAIMMLRHVGGTFRRGVRGSEGRTGWRRRAGRGSVTYSYDGMAIAATMLLPADSGV